MPLFHLRRLAVLAGTLGIAVTLAGAQSVGNSGSVTGTVTDSTGAVVAGAKVQIHNPVSGFDRSTTTDNAGAFAFTNIPFNHYHLSVTAAGFMAYAQDVEPRSSVPVTRADRISRRTAPCTTGSACSRGAGRTSKKPRRPRRQSATPTSSSPSPRPASRSFHVPGFSQAPI